MQIYARSFERVRMSVEYDAAAAAVTFVADDGKKQLAARVPRAELLTVRSLHCGDRIERYNYVSASSQFPRLYEELLFSRNQERREEYSLYLCRGAGAEVDGKAVLSDRRQADWIQVKMQDIELMQFLDEVARAVMVADVSASVLVELRQELQSLRYEAGLVLDGNGSLGHNGVVGVGDGGDIPAQDAGGDAVEVVVSAPVRVEQVTQAAVDAVATPGRAVIPSPSRRQWGRRQEAAVPAAAPAQETPAPKPAAGGDEAESGPAGPPADPGKPYLERWENWFVGLDRSAKIGAIEGEMSVLEALIGSEGLQAFHAGSLRRKSLTDATDEELLDVYRAVLFKLFKERKEQ